MSDIRPLTEQEMFNRVYTHFVINNNPRGINEYERCKYRTDKGAVCAIGLFIPTNEYDNELEGYSPSDLRKMVPTLELLIENISDVFLKELQAVHDWSNGLEAILINGKTVYADRKSTIKERLLEFAKAYELTIPE